MHLYLVDHAIITVVMQMHILDSENRVHPLQRHCCLALQAAGYGDVVKTKLQIAIMHITKQLKPHYLQNEMWGIVSWRKNENFDNVDFNRLMRKVAIQTEKLQENHRVL